MISVYLVTDHASDEPNLKTDLDAVGIKVVGETESAALVQHVIRLAPDVVICYKKHPDDALFSSTLMLSSSAPRPVIIFTTDPDADKIERASRSGIHAYVINGYGQHRLRSVIHVAQARFRQDQLLRDELQSVNSRFDERKLVDRAKGILMRARQTSEDNAYRALRTAAMQTKQRIGQVSQQVITSAVYGEAVNRAGQLRMLSQRIVKLYAAQCLALEPATTAGLLSDSTEHVANNLSILRRSLSTATFGDLIDAVNEPWLRLKAVMTPPSSVDRLMDVDAQAEDLLANAERLTSNIETAELAKTLRVINVSGRQRMLTDRMAKQALMAALRGAEADKNARDVTVTSFTEGLEYLTKIPLSTAAIGAELTRATQNWNLFRFALGQTHSKQSQTEIMVLSERLVGSFDKLTELYELSMHILIG